MEESAQPKPANPSEPELSSDPPKGAGTNADGWRRGRRQEIRLRRREWGRIRHARALHPRRQGRLHPSRSERSIWWVRALHPQQGRRGRLHPRQGGLHPPGRPPGWRQTSPWAARRRWWPRWGWRRRSASRCCCKTKPRCCAGVPSCSPTAGSPMPLPASSARSVPPRSGAGTRPTSSDTSPPWSAPSSLPSFLDHPHFRLTNPLVCSATADATELPWPSRKGEEETSGWKGRRPPGSELLYSTKIADARITPSSQGGRAGGA